MWARWETLEGIYQVQAHILEDCFWGKYINKSVDLDKVKRQQLKLGQKV